MSTTTAPRTKPLKVASASFIGTTIEFYDFFIFGTAAALVFPKLFFPGESPLLGALLSFATFGVGFLARPLGGIVFGHYGDRIGRKKMLVISLVGMGSATFLMGLLPGYATIGILAPILLAVLRLIQGFCVGGEWGGATLMAVEHAPIGKRGFYGAFTQMGSPGGVALATLVFLAVANCRTRQFLTWGWRIPFLFSAVLVAVGLFIRISVTESPEFVKVKVDHEQVKLPVKVAFQKYWRQILLVAGIFISQGIFAYICISYFVVLRHRCPQDRPHRGAARESAPPPSSPPSSTACSARVSDHIGRKTTYLIGAVAMAVSIAPAIALINTGNPWLFGVALMLVFGLAMSPAGGATGSLFSLMFGAEVRYTGVSLGYTIAQLCGSAFAPLIAVALYGATGSTNGLLIYMLAASAISITSLLLLGGPFGPQGSRPAVRTPHRTDGRTSDVPTQP